MQQKERGRHALVFERSGNEKKLVSDYHVGERHAVEYWINFY
jgi:hypothetical protein